MFSVRATSRFERDAQKLAKKYPDFVKVYEQAIEILARDPYNHKRKNPIKKLRGVPRGQAQYRIRLRRFRIRYDINQKTVFLMYCAIRTEHTYKKQ